jgi:hypothetical protein
MVITDSLNQDIKRLAVMWITLAIFAVASVMTFNKLSQTRSSTGALLEKHSLVCPPGCEPRRINGIQTCVRIGTLTPCS